MSRMEQIENGRPGKDSFNREWTRMDANETVVLTADFADGTDGRAAGRGNSFPTNQAAVGLDGGKYLADKR